MISKFAPRKINQIYFTLWYFTVLNEYQIPFLTQYPIRNQMSWSNTNAPTPTQVCRERNKIADELANICFGWQIIVLINFIKDNLDMKNL